MRRVASLALMRVDPLGDGVVEAPIGRRWGWDELMTAAAGADARLPKLETRRAYRLQLLCMLRRAREELGRWPTAGEWDLATASHVSRRSYVRNFGSWRRACRTAARLRL